MVVRPHQWFCLSKIPIKIRRTLWMISPGTFFFLHFWDRIFTYPVSLWMTQCTKGRSTAQMGLSFLSNQYDDSYCSDPKSQTLAFLQIHCTSMINMLITADRNLQVTYLTPKSLFLISRKREARN
jgi:hypothetical protein